MDEKQFKSFRDKDFMKQPFYNKLGYATQIKSHRIILCNQFIREKGKESRKSLGITGLAILLTFFLSYQTINSSISTITAGKVFSGVNLIAFLLLLGALILGFILWYLLDAEVLRLKNYYKTLEEELMKIMGSGLCTCSNSCDCKDEFLKYMNEQRDIDLILPNAVGK